MQGMTFLSPLPKISLSPPTQRKTFPSPSIHRRAFFSLYTQGRAFRSPPTQSGSAYGSAVLTQAGSAYGSAVPTGTTSSVRALCGDLQDLGLRLDCVSPC